MALYTIADLHLPLGIDKPMDIFGKNWENYVERLADNWQSNVRENDTVVLPGDFSWATYLEQSVKDFEYLHRLNGKKILLKGNHDYWWTTMNKLREFAALNGFGDIEFLQNNSFMYEDIAICGTRGWINPAWDNFSGEDKKIFDREVQRLELSLRHARDYSEIYVFTHYPPMPLSKETNAFTEMMKQYPVTKCMYGHLHGAAHRNAVEGIIDGIEYRLVSGDYTAFNPIKIHD
ncbi:MAG: metallophosphoesterase [Oscillospiraceae bacterium]|nr:metallophosphoesterase [Oscillospiraceae bacterium]